MIPRFHRLARRFVGPGTVMLLACSMHGCSRNAALRDELATRASFDFSCPRNDLQFRILERHLDTVRTYGVSGCGQRGTYVLSVRDIWILNTASASSRTVTETVTGDSVEQQTEPAEQALPAVEHYDQGQSNRAIRVRLQAAGASWVFFYAPERSRDTVTLRVTGASAAGCQEVRFAAGTEEVTVALQGGNADLSRDAFMALATSASLITIDYCGRSTRLRAADVGALRQVQEVPMTLTPVRTPSADRSAAIRRRLDADSGAILSCANSTVVTVEATWNASGTVSAQARDAGDPATTECIEASLGTFSVGPGQAGRLLHIVR